jgi:hypothetical protein
MRIYEIIFLNDDPAERNRSDPQLGPPSPPFSDDLTDLANAFTRSGLVKSGWNTNRWEGQPSGPAPPDPGTELIPSGPMEPIKAASWEAQPVEEEPPSIGPFLFGHTEGYQETDLGHVIDTTARPRAPHLGTARDP